MVATVGFKVNKTEINSVKESVKSIKFGFLKMAGAIVAAGTAFVLFESHLGKMGTQLSNTSQILQVPTDQLQAMKLAAEKAGVPFQTLTSAVGGFQKAIVNMKAGQGLPENMQKGLGDLARITGVALNPQSFKNGNDFFKQFAKTLKLVPTTQGKEGVLNMMFGNSNLLPLLAGGMKDINKAYKQLKAEGALLTPDDISKMHKFNGEMALAKQQMSVLTAEVGIKLMPVLESLFTQMAKLGKDKNFVNGLKDIGVVLSFVVKLVVKLIAGLGYLVSFWAKNLSKSGSAFSNLLGYKKMPSFEWQPHKGQSQGPHVAIAAPEKILSHHIGGMFSAIGNHMANAVAGAQSQAGISKGSVSNSVSNNTNNTSNHTTHNTTVINTHSHLQMMSAHVTGGFQ